MRCTAVPNTNWRTPSLLSLAGLASLLMLTGCSAPSSSFTEAADAEEDTAAQALKATPRRVSIVGRDTWVPTGTSRLLRVVASGGIQFSETVPAVTFSPGPVVVNYVVASSTELTISVTVPYETLPGSQTIEITDGSSQYNLRDAVKVVDGTIPPLSPSIVSPGITTSVTIQPHSLFAGQSSFILDLGPRVSVGPITLQPDGSLQTSIRVSPSAIPGSRSVHLTAGPYSLLGERGFAIDFGPLVTRVHLQVTGMGAGSIDLHLPRGYTARVLASSTPANGLFHPAGMYVDETNTLYVLNYGGPFRSPPYSISVFDVAPDRFGLFKAVFRDIDVAGYGGFGESGTMIPSRPGKLFVTVEDFYPPDDYRGGRVMYEVDTATGESRLFWYNPLWNFDPIRTDVDGNMAFGHTLAPPDFGGVSIMDANANILKTCPVGLWTAILEIDPLSGTFLMNRAVAGYGGLETVDLRDCTTTTLSDGPIFDEGRFAPAGGSFGNQMFAPVSGGTDLVTLVPVSYTDPDQTFPERPVVFASVSGICPDDIAFDRDGYNMLVVDECNHNVIAISRNP